MRHSPSKSVVAVSPPSPVAADAAPVAVPGPAPMEPEARRGMLAITFAFEKGKVVVAKREEVQESTVRPLRRLEGTAGIYYRVVDAQGQVLFENVVPDPRRVPWDTTDDGKKLIGGVALTDTLPLMLRLPAGLKGRLQIIEMKTPGWTRESLDKTTVLMGDFDL